MHRCLRLSMLVLLRFIVEFLLLVLQRWENQWDHWTARGDRSVRSQALVEWADFRLCPADWVPLRFPNKGFHTKYAYFGTNERLISLLWNSSSVALGGMSCSAGYFFIRLSSWSLRSVMLNALERKSLETSSSNLGISWTSNASLNVLKVNSMRDS